MAEKAEVRSTFLNPRKQDELSSWQYGFKFREWGDSRYGLYLLINNDRTWTFELRGDANRVLDSGTVAVEDFDDRVSDPVSNKWYSGNLRCYWPSQYRNTLGLSIDGKFDFRFFVNGVEVPLNIDEEEQALLNSTLYERLDIKNHWGTDTVDLNDLWGIKSCRYNEPQDNCYFLHMGSTDYLGGRFAPLSERGT